MPSCSGRPPERGKHRPRSAGRLPSAGRAGRAGRQCLRDGGLDRSDLKSRAFSQDHRSDSQRSSNGLSLIGVRASEALTGFRSSE
ncbi:Hypp9601 [Branchiostoma lanceolatum]|uniref:Hypp9601 protein n=1 Tax=Branchiostoma lanceolatum TaxID=7740 RepID=A0A8S4MNA0_BRALA|nr:Hypp9601 [Branchiostoma lanceolatum]